MNFLYLTWKIEGSNILQTQDLLPFATNIQFSKLCINQLYYCLMSNLDPVVSLSMRDDIMNYLQLDHLD